MPGFSRENSYFAIFGLSMGEYIFVESMGVSKLILAKYQMD